MKIQMIASSARHLMHANQRCSIYKLYSKDPEINEIYIGCTKRLLRHMTKHYYVRHTSTTPLHNACVYRFIREHGGWNDWTHGILETATLTTMEQRKLKRRYIETLNATLKTYLPTRTDRERKFNARRKARYAKQQQSQQENVIPAYLCLTSMYLTNQISYIKFRFKGESWRAYNTSAKIL